jgi:predicted MPP superfamily phosphohydrolase
MFSTFPAAVAAYLYLSLVRPLKGRLAPKLLVLGLLLLASGRFVILRWIFGGRGGVEAPWLLQAGTALLQGGAIFLFLMSVPKDVLRLATFASPLIGRREGGRRLRAWLASLPFVLALTAIALSLSGYSLWRAARVPDTREETVYLNAWPAELEGLRVAVISDLHVSRLFDREWVRAVVDRVNALDPELILIPGDVVDGTPAQRRPDVEPLRDLRSEYGVYMCPGNHEYISDMRDWLAAFEGLGIRNLYNDHVTLRLRQGPGGPGGPGGPDAEGAEDDEAVEAAEAGEGGGNFEGGEGAQLVLAGVTDPAASRRGLPGPDLPKALRGVPRDGPPVILLDHRPGHATRNSLDGRVRLQLSGHTHGGLVPGIATLVARANGGFLKGWYEVGGLMMYVHPGTGLWSGLPMRLFNPSEITLLTVRDSRALAGAD